MVDPAEIDRYRLVTSELSKRVTAELAAYFAALDLSRPEAVRDALLEFLPHLVAEYGQVADVLAMDWYEELRGASGAVGRFSATAAPSSVTAERVQKKIRFLSDQLWTPDPSSILGSLKLATDKYVKQHGRDTVAWNAEREGVRWARVPTGAKTCSWCLVLASRDAVYSSKQSAGDRRGTGKGDAFHGDCNCAVVRIGKASDYPPGYLPDNYYSMYSDALNADDPEIAAFLASLPADDKNKQLKAAAFAMRRKFPDVVNDGVHTH
ncbi:MULTISPECIES: hypothetical protein [Arthrobacter]|uniref:Uncharacterized protein n=1 Tax=Arthrobacter terricola TaxID=2547396 RepID=A0A4R5KD11_9MICC|nr:MULTISPECIES: hypothetical protein [Arthrobacter]MBT8162804.1 hypothetical protein [Arthrobacter sp. GN70]TDF92037.1 hypothetical protein E1809_18835 [Arthrobacter terricola]